MNAINEEAMIPHILSLADQSRWTKWDEVIELDLKWKEIMYGMSPSMLSFILFRTLSLTQSIYEDGRSTLKPSADYAGGRTQVYRTSLRVAGLLSSRVGFPIGTIVS